MKRKVSDTFFGLALLVSSVGGAYAAEPVLIPEWQVVGPFESGSREGFVHNLAGRDGVIPRTFSSHETYPSALAEGGRARWKTVQAERDDKGVLTGKTSLKLEGVEWDARESEWGAAAAANTAYASATFTLAQDGLYLLEASRCGVLLNGVSFAGDPYGQGVAQSVVRAKVGVNDVLVSTTGFGPERAFEVMLTPIPAREAVRINATDVLLPDIVATPEPLPPPSDFTPGIPSGFGWAGVPLINLLDGWQPGLRIVIDGGLTGSATVPASLPPLGSYKAPVYVYYSWTAQPATDPKSVEVRIRVFGPERSHDDWPLLATATVRADVRKRDEPRSDTFLSRIDGSAQKYGLRPATPRGDTIPTNLALILSLHGAAVDCRGQASAYSPKDWADVVAPTNRRAFGFDWHDWGALDAEEVLDVAMWRLKTDPECVHLAGHSMGGHGTWTFGASHAGTFATIAPSAGWNGYDTYMPGTLRRATWFAPPELAEMWQRGISAGRVGPMLENLVATPAFVMHGAADDNVPATHARILSGELERLGGNVIYREVPGQGHWWDLDKTRPGADCVDSEEMEAFWRAHELNRWPARVVLGSPDPDLARSAHWLTLEKQERVHEMSRIEAEAVVPTPENAVVSHQPVTGAPRVVVSTRNVLAFTMHLGTRLVPEGGVDVSIDGQVTRVSLGPGREFVTCNRDQGSTWRLSAGALPAKPVAPARRATSPGGFQKALYEPFTLVVGTSGDDARDERLLDLARSLSLAWWVRANGSCPVVRDIDVSDDLRATRNLVLLGGPEANSEARRLERSLLIVARASGVTLAGRSVPGADLACAHWQPSPEHPARRVLVLQGTSPFAEGLLGSLNPIGGGHGLPDFVVATPAVRLRSWAGFAAAGYWSPDFRFDRANAWLALERR